MAAAFDPYHKWLGIPADQQPPNCYRLLGIRDFEDDLEVIQAAADQRTTHLRSFQGGTQADLAARLLGEVQQARNRLLDADNKPEYDAQLREQQATNPTRIAERSSSKTRIWPDGKAPSNVEDFLQCLEASRVMPEDDSRRFLSTLPESKRPDTAKNLAIELIKAGKLTRHQAESVLKGKIKFLTFGEYVILEKLGQGGMGQVLKAEHRRMRRTVALKVISGPLMKDADTVRRFQREVHAAARLIHPNIVTAFDANEHEGVHFFVMEYVEGRDLAELVNDEGPLPVAQAVDYVLQAARGLAYAHGKGIVHRDIKPANLLLDNEGTVKILDMGLARMELSADDGQELTNTGQVMGTVDYMAPEQAEDTHAVDARADIYSLGCTLYRLLAGQVLYGADTVVKKLLAHRTKPIPFLGSVCKGIPRELEATFQKMVAKRPEDRQPTMAHVVAELESCLRSSSPSRPLPRSTESTVDFPLSDIMSSPGSLPGKQSSAALVPKAEKTQSAATEVTQNFAKGDTGVSIGAAIGNVNPSTNCPITPTAAFASVGWDNDARGAAVSPALISPSLKSRLTKNRLPLLIAAALSGIALLAAGIVILLPAGDATIRIEIEDPSIEVTVAASGYTIKGKTEEIHIKPGEHTLHVKTGDLEFDTTKFTLGKGENPAVKVDLLADKVQVVSAGGKIFGEKARQVVTTAPAPSAIAARAPSATADGRGSVPMPGGAPAGFALQFDGQDDYVEIPSLKYDGTHPLTIEAQVRPGEAKNEAVMQIFGPDAWMSLAGGNNSTWGTLVAAGTQHLMKFEARSFQTGQPTRLAAVWDQKELRLYINGQVVPAARPTTPSQHEGVTTIGAGYGGPRMFYFAGAIDELRVSKFARYDKDYVPVPRLDPDADTVALYHFDEGAGDVLNDSSGNGHHGKVVGAKWVPGVAGGPPVVQRTTDNSALSIDGAGEYASFPNPYVDYSQPLTLEAWVRPTELSTNAYFLAAPSSITLKIQKVNDPKLPEYVWQFVGYAPDGKLYGTTSRVPPAVGEWTHLAGVWEGNNLCLYVNGGLHYKLPVPDGLRGPKAGEPVFTGPPPPQARGFRGQIDEIRLSKIARYAANFTPERRFQVDADTLALYHLDEGQGSVAGDSSGNNHHGKIVGAKWVSAPESSTTSSLSVPKTGTFKPETNSPSGDKN